MAIWPLVWNNDRTPRRGQPVSWCDGYLSVETRGSMTLYLKGISTGDFTEALSAILGERAAGLSATNIVRLKGGCEEDYKAWCQRDLSPKRYV